MRPRSAPPGRTRKWGKRPVLLFEASASSIKMRFESCIRVENQQTTGSGRGPGHVGHTKKANVQNYIRRWVAHHPFHLLFPTTSASAIHPDLTFQLKNKLNRQCLLSPLPLLKRLLPPPLARLQPSPPREPKLLRSEWWLRLMMKMRWSDSKLRNF